MVIAVGFMKAGAIDLYPAAVVGITLDDFIGCKEKELGDQVGASTSKSVGLTLSVSTLFSSRNRTRSDPISWHVEL